jgi:NADH dehydrogenase FAD-containing subunit
MTATRGLTKIGVIGGNFGGLGFVTALVKTLDLKDYNIEVTIFDKRDGFCYLIGATEAFVDEKIAPVLWCNHSELYWYNNPSIKFKYLTVTKVNEHSIKTDNGEVEDFDFIVVATGSSRSEPITLRSNNLNEYTQEYKTMRQRIESASSVIIVGAGAVGVELAGDTKCHFPEKSVTLVHSRDLPISGPYTNEFKQKVASELKDLGVELVFGNRVLSQSERTVDGKTVCYLNTNQGIELTADLIINCTGAGNPNTTILDLESTNDYPLLDEDQLVKVKPTMQLLNPKYSHIFAIGDINDWQAVKLAGAAMHQGLYSAKNIKHILDTSPGENPELDDYPRMHLHMFLFIGKYRGLGECETGIIGYEKLLEISHGDRNLRLCKQRVGFVDEVPKYIKF